MILSLVNDKDYFVITTNVDHCFQKTGFDKKRLFYTQGDYGLLQCPTPCCNETFDNEDIIKQMYKSQSNMKIPTGLIPLCPHCKKPLTTNERSKYCIFGIRCRLQHTRNYKISVLENGIGQQKFNIRLH